MKNSIRKAVLLLGMWLLVATINAQTPPHPGDGNGGAPGPGDPPVGAPIDGGLSLLIVLGSAYGFSRTRKK